MHAQSDVPKAVADLVRWLSDRSEPVPFPELPDPLRNPDVLTVGERRGLIVRATRIEAEPTRWDGRNLCVGHSGGWQLATPGDGPDHVFVGLTREGRAWVAERRLAEAETESGVRSQGVQAVPAAKPTTKATRRRKRQPRIALTDRQQFVYELRKEARLPFAKIAERLSADFPRRDRRPYTRQAAAGLYRRAKAVLERRKHNAEARLSLHRGA